jgi:hypothetical protein
VENATRTSAKALMSSTSPVTIANLAMSTVRPDAIHKDLENVILHALKAMDCLRNIHVKYVTNFVRVGAVWLDLASVTHHARLDIHSTLLRRHATNATRNVHRRAQHKVSVNATTLAQLATN